MAMSPEERKKRQRERMMKNRRAAGMKPRAPAMSEDEKKVAEARNSRNYRTREKGKTDASRNAVAITGQLTSENNGVGSTVASTKPTRKTARGEDRLKITDTHIEYRGFEVSLDSRFCKEIPRRQWKAELDWFRKREDMFSAAKAKRVASDESCATSITQPEELNPLTPKA